MKLIQFSEVILKSNNNSHIVIKGNYIDCNKTFTVNIIRDVYNHQQLSDNFIILNFNGRNYCIILDFEEGHFDIVNNFYYKDYDIPRAIYCMMYGLLSVE